MMKKLTSKLMIGLFTVMVVGLFLSIYIVPKSYAKEVSSKNFLTNSIPNIILENSSNIQYITAENYNATQMKKVLEAGGIVVDTSGCSQDIAEDMGIRFSISDNVDTESDPGKDVATLYYRYGADIAGMYIINIGTEDIVNQEELVQEAIAVILDRQANYASAEAMSVSDALDLTASTYSATMLGTFDITTVREPKGKINASCNVYTVQDYSERDYYIIKATVTGYPGCVLGSAYESKYLGKAMTVELGTSTTSVTVDAYGPSRDIASGSSTYGVSLDTSFNGESFVLQFGLNYTKTLNTTDTTISTTGTSTSREWNVQLKDTAQKTFFDFTPGVTFDCPYNKSSVALTIYASYDLDSWDTVLETISLNRVITCTASTATIN